MKDKTLSVSAINEGTVIDHIPADSLFDVLSILKLDELENQITFGTNLKSERYGKKAIIKLEGKFFEDDEINRIALVAPEAKLNIIRDYEVAEKKIVGLPDEIHGIAKCMNPKCVTNHQNIPTHFRVKDKKLVTLKCHYCEKITDKKHLEIL
ncbi:MAG: aspartate carbamoyltransferase regulatory subunit [Salinivirgaceae bacterium]|jgi:aspartate carbamoyltransferase regulatory subunit